MDSDWLSVFLSSINCHFIYLLIILLASDVSFSLKLCLNSSIEDTKKRHPFPLKPSDSVVLWDVCCVPPALFPGGPVSCFISGPCHCALLSADDWHEGLGDPRGPVGSGWKKGYSAYVQHWVNRTCTLDLTSAPLRHIYNDLGWT